LGTRGDSLAILDPAVHNADDYVRLYPFHLPLSPEWEEQKDIFGSSSTMGSGAGIFLKNPL
jgi:hypothetical protein